jgi:hypothetical protein
MHPKDIPFTHSTVWCVHQALRLPQQGWKFCAKAATQWTPQLQPQQL